MEIVCPHCEQYIIIEKLNCGIFRHGVYKTGGQIGIQIYPHMEEEQCLQLVKEDKIYGCGKPFQIIIVDGEWKVQICDYI
jgi:hypothetical protein